MASFNPVTALTRGLEVLRIVNALGEASAAEVTRRAKLPRPTVIRMLETLEEVGYVTRRSDSARYMPTGRVLLLSSGYVAHQRIGEVAEPVLAELREKLGWPSSIAIPDGSSMLVAYSSRSFESVLINARSGTRAPLLGSALGRAYIAFCPDDERERLLDMLRAAQPGPFDKALLDNPRALATMLKTTREEGYAMPDPAYTRSVYNNAGAGFAVPVVSAGRTIGSINIVFFASALSLDEAIAAFLPEMLAAARRVGERLATEQGVATPVAR